jgi:hypothetical protein
MLPEFIVSLHATKRREDWSRVRSPSRAARRLAKGIRKHAVPIIEEPACYAFGNRMVIHPDLMRKLRAATAPSIARGA